MINLLPDSQIGYALTIFGLSVCSMIVVTFRLIMVVRGYTVISTGLTSVHALLLVLVLGAVFTKFDNPLNMIAYAAGVGSGNAIGIFLEGKLAIGYTEARIISTDASSRVAEALRSHGYGATEIAGHGARGPVNVTVCIVRRREVPRMQAVALRADPNCFITVEDTKPMRRTIWPA